MRNGNVVLNADHDWRYVGSNRDTKIAYLIYECTRCGMIGSKDYRYQYERITTQNMATCSEHIVATVMKE